MVKIVVTFVSSGKIKLQDYVLMSLSFRLLNDFIEYKDTSSKQDSILIDKEQFYLNLGTLEELEPLEEM